MTSKELPQMKTKSQSPTPPPVITSFDSQGTISVTVSMPLIPWSGYTSKRLDAHLNGKQAANLRSLTLALESRSECLANGKPIVRPSDAVKWLLEQLRCEEST